MYKLTGKAFVFGKHAVIGVKLVYGRGKHADVWLVNRIDEPKPDLLSLVSADKSKHRFYQALTLAESTAHHLEARDVCITTCKGAHKGKSMDDMVRSLQLA